MMSLQLLGAWTAVLYFVYLIYRQRRLSAFPGPFLAGFTGWWRAYRYRKGDFVETVAELHKKHGPLVRIGPNSLSVSDALSVKTVHQINPVLVKGSIYKALSIWDRGQNVSGLAGTRDETEHNVLKRIVGNSFTANSVEKHEPVLDKYTMELMHQLERLGQFDMTKWFLYFAADTMNAMGFSADQGFMKRGTGIDASQTPTAAMTVFFSWAMAVPTVALWMRWAMSYLISLRQRVVGLSLHYIDGRMEQRASNDFKAHNKDFLNTFFNIREQRPDLMSPERVLSITISTILAGSDTVAMTMITMMHELLKSPHSLTRLAEEIDQASRQGQLSFPPTLKELSRLPYLDAVIKETLRVSDFLQFNLERVVPAGGMELCGQYIPAGTEVGGLPKVINNDEAVYGADAATFRPERWIESKASDQGKDMDRCGLWFGSGKRVCLGQHIAVAEMKKVLASMLMRFDVSDPTPKARLSWYRKTTSCYPDAPYFVSVKRKGSGPKALLAWGC